MCQYFTEPTHLYSLTQVLKIHMDNLQEIKVICKEFIKYKVTFYENEEMFEQMKGEAKQRTAVEMLKDIAACCTRGSDAIDEHRMVALQVGPRFGLKLQPHSVQQVKN